MISFFQNALAVHHPRPRHAPGPWVPEAVRDGVDARADQLISNICSTNLTRRFGVGRHAIGKCKIKANGADGGDMVL